MIQTIRHGDIVELRLDRPPVNALDTELLSRLIDAVDRGRGAQALVLSGGPRVFCGGMDVPHLLSLDEAGVRRAWQLLFAAARALARSPAPVVAAIDGHAPAGGCVLALCCDYRVMAEGEFRIGLNETQVGLAAPDAIQHLMRRVVGTYRAERLLVSGTMLESAQALAVGLVDELAPSGQVVPRALEWLHALLALPRSAMLTTRRIARADLLSALEGFSDPELDVFLAAWEQDDTQQALRALVARLSSGSKPRGE
jgi:enoyl-CoA hydratase/carnithine racemase